VGWVVGAGAVMDGGKIITPIRSAKVVLFLVLIFGGTTAMF